jgi:hypothetical protein
MRLAIVSDESADCDVEAEVEVVPVFPVDWEDEFPPRRASAICGLVENRLVFSIAFNVADSSNRLKAF